MEILFEVKNSTGVITLSRPKALNALNLNMAIQLSKKLKEWEEDNAVERVILLGEGNHFCAGGDVKSVHLSGPFSELKREFFSKEYSLNLQIKNFPKPYLSIWKGVVMGGGVGLSIYGDYRIATDSTKFAMPETSIGFFPDVGGSFFLAKLEDFNDILRREVVLVHICSFITCSKFVWVVFCQSFLLLTDFGYVVNALFR